MPVNKPQAKSELLSDEVRAGIDHWTAKYPPEQRQSAVIPALSLVQEACGGSLTRELMDAVADYLGMPEIAVYEVGSFYSMLNLKPVGRHEVAICTNISCMLCGADNIVSHIERKLGIKLGETTPDGKFTLKVEEECLAACAGGPMMAVDGHYYENLTPDTVDAILDNLE
ncbi:MAG: NAD(P)H-dependent oxidoreductase subunit E [Chromatiales bacterium]|nr:NAD(P)H-dependent oxidoreductase subunit E [Chromatiales bacterium]